MDHRADARPTSRPRIGLAALCAIIVPLVIALAYAARAHALDVDQDGIAYLRVAKYISEGRFALALTGYWGPLLSWIVAPLLWLGFELPLAGHTASAIGGLLFSLTALSVLHRAGLSRAHVIVGTAIVAVATVAWATRSVTPDLLVSSFLLLAWSRLADADWPASTRMQVAAGACLGLAYLAKAVALPVGVLSLGVLALVHVASASATWKSVVRAAATSGMVFAAVAAPWIAALSLHYGKPTFSTSGPINHAIVGPESPPDAIIHPYRTSIYAPEPGRVTAWEEPSGMDYPRWSPLASVDAFVHQLGLVRRNHAGIFGALVSMDLLSLGVIALPAAFLFHRPWRENSRRQRWRWFFAMVLPLFVIYLPVFSRSPRYFFAAFPLMIGSSLGLVSWLVAEEEWRSRAPWSRLAAAAPAMVACIAFGIPALLDAAQTLASESSGAAKAAHRTAAALEDAGLAERGFVGGGELGTSLAFFAGRPWCGDLGYERWTVDRVRAHRDAIAASPCRIVVAPRDAALDAVLRDELGARSLDDVLVEQRATRDASRLPFALYELP